MDSTGDWSFMSFFAKALLPDFLSVPIGVAKAHGIGPKRWGVHLSYPAFVFVQLGSSLRRDSGLPSISPACLLLISFLHPYLRKGFKVFFSKTIESFLIVNKSLLTKTSVCTMQPSQCPSLEVDLWRYLPPWNTDQGPSWWTDLSSCFVACPSRMLHHSHLF